MSMFTFLKSSRESRFTSQFKPHLQGMYHHAYRLTGNQDDAEDLVQDTLIHLYEKQIDLQNIEKPSSWILKSLYHQFVDNYRKKGRLPIDSKESESHDILDAIHDDSKSPHSLTEKSSTQKYLHLAIMQLNHEQQAVITLHDIEGYNLTELSGILDTPVGTLKSRLHRARKSLRKFLLEKNINVEPFSNNQRVNG